MNIRFTIEEENIIAIYAEDSRERTIDNINSAMPYMDEDMRGCRLPAPHPRFLSFQQDYLFSLFLCVPQRRICPAEVAPNHNNQIVAIIHKPPVAGGYCPLIVYLR